MLMTRSAPSSLPIARRLSRVPVRMTGLAPRAFATATARSPIGPGPMTTTLSPATSPPASGQAVHGGPRGDDKRGFRIAHRIGYSRQRIDMVDRVFGETAIGREPVGAVTFIGISIVNARGVHALAASLALAATSVDFHADAFADVKFV